MALNIKSEEAHRLAHELATLTGESLTTAVTEALRQRLLHLRHRRPGSLAEQLVALGKDCAAHLRDPWKTVDHGDLLFDERGLPE